jgi:hypothetical protein
MNRSSSFGSILLNYFNSFSLLRLLNIITRWFMIQKVRCHKNSLLLQHYLYTILRLFHPSFSVLFTFPSRYFPLSVFSLYLNFEEGTPFFKQVWLNSFYSTILCFSRYGALTLFSTFSSLFSKKHFPYVFSLLSLATTYKISFDFFSYNYLDVSVHCVFFL